MTAAANVTRGAIACWRPVPKHRNLGRGQIPMPRSADIMLDGRVIGRLREMYGSRFGRAYDAFDLHGKMIASNTSLVAALTAAEAHVNG